MMAPENILGFVRTIAQKILDYYQNFLSSSSRPRGLLTCYNAQASIKDAAVHPGTQDDASDTVCIGCCFKVKVVTLIDNDISKRFPTEVHLKLTCSRVLKSTQYPVCTAHEQARERERGEKEEEVSEIPTQVWALGQGERIEMHTRCI